MLFSVVIPVYNIEKYLEECINSVISQSYKNIEVILVNDGSTDKSGNICDYYQIYDSRIKVIHKKNGGLSAARNSGIDIATGKYILFLDGDDKWKSDFLHEVAETIDKNNNIDLIFVDSIYSFFPRGKILEEKCDFKAQELDVLCGESALEYIFSNCESGAWSAWRHIYNLAFLKENNLFFKDKILCEDAEWTPRVILKTKKIALYTKPFYMYRLGRVGSIMNVCSEKRVLDYLEIVKGWINCSNNMDNENLSRIIRNKFCNSYIEYLKYLYFFDEEFVENLIKELKENKILLYANSQISLRIKDNIAKHGYKKTLKILNLKYRIREVIKNIAIRLYLIDR